MSIDDLLKFDASAYARKLNTLSDNELRQRQVQKRREMLLASYRIYVGSFLAIPTYGGSLPTTLYGARVFSIADQKTVLIQAELKVRNKPQARYRIRDVTIPTSLWILSFGLSHTLVEGVTSLIVDSSNVNSSACGPSGPIHDAIPGAHQDTSSGTENVLGQVAHDIGSSPLAETAQHFGHGVHQEVDVLGQNIQEMTTPDDFSQPLSHTRLHLDSSTPAYNLGVHDAIVVESEIVASAAQEITTELIRRCEGNTIDAQSTTNVIQRLEAIHTMVICPRALGGQFKCQNCSVSIKRGQYKHCCACNHNFDLCTKCFDNGKRCEPEHELKTLQVALPIGRTDEMKECIEKCIGKQTASTSLTCATCSGAITQDRVYTCPICRDHNYDMCSSCFKNGSTCLNPDNEHTLYTYMWSGLADFSTANPYFSKLLPWRKNGIVGCNSCHQDINQGSFLHCTKCRNFDLCGPCYEAGKTCPNKTHGLVKYYAYSKIRIQKRSELGSVCCGLCTIELKDENFCFECNVCRPVPDEPDTHVVTCKTCYILGAGCLKRKHGLVKVKIVDD